MVEDAGVEPEGVKGDKDLIDDMSLVSSTRLYDYVFVLCIIVIVIYIFIDYIISTPL